MVELAGDPFSQLSVVPFRRSTCWHESIRSMHCVCLRIMHVPLQPECRLALVKATAIQLSEPKSAEYAMQARPILSSPAFPIFRRSLLPKAFSCMAIRQNVFLHPDHADRNANRALDLSHLP